eukprot:1721860-Prymnesium_polylepis.1
MDTALRKMPGDSYRDLSTPPTRCRRLAMTPRDDPRRVPAADWAGACACRLPLRTVFRYAVVGREGSSVQALRDANRVDAEQM